MSGLRLHEQAWQRAIREFSAACEVQPLIEEAIYHAGTTEGADRAAHVAFAASMLAPLAPSLPEPAWRTLLLAEATGSELRTTYVPGIPEPTVWVVRGDGDAEALRSYIVPGQVWMRTDHLTSDAAWKLVADHARYANATDFGRLPIGGRPPGATNKQRDRLLAEVRADPSITDDAIDARGVELEIWTDAPGDYHTKAKRIDRARKDAALR